MKWRLFTPIIIKVDDKSIEHHKYLHLKSETLPAHGWCKKSNANTILHTASGPLLITWHSWCDFRNLMKFVLWIFVTVSTAIWKESFHKSLYQTYIFRCCFSSCCVIDNFRVFQRRYENVNKGMDYGRSFPLGILKKFFSKNSIFSIPY